MCVRCWVSFFPILIFTLPYTLALWLRLMIVGHTTRGGRLAEDQSYIILDRYLVYLNIHIPLTYQPIYQIYPLFSSSSIKFYIQTQMSSSSLLYTLPTPLLNQRLEHSFIPIITTRPTKHHILPIIILRISSTPRLIQCIESPSLVSSK